MFHNIFSKKQEKQVQKLKIIIDNREKQSLVPAELAKLNFQIEFQQLSLGDYIVNNTIIERKTFNDLQSSIISKRIFSQLGDLQKTNSLLIIEKSTEERVIMHQNAIRGFFLSLATEFKVPFIFSENEKETALYLSILTKKPINRDISIRQSRSFLSVEQQKQFILEGFSGIGPKTAKRLIEKYKSLNKIFSLNKEELAQIIGKKAEDFTKILSE